MDYSIRSVLVAFFLLNIWQCNAALRTYDFTVHRGVRAPGKSKHPVLSDLVLCSSTDNDPDGVSREVYLVNGQQPGPLIEVDEGDDIEVFVTNELPVETTIHWHGKDHKLPLEQH